MENGQCTNVKRDRETGRPAKRWRIEQFTYFLLMVYGRHKLQASSIIKFDQMCFAFPWKLNERSILNARC